MITPKFSSYPPVPDHLFHRSSQHPSTNLTTGVVQTASVKAIHSGNGLTVITPGSTTVTPSPVPDVSGKGGIKSPPALPAAVAAGVASQ